MRVMRACLHRSVIVRDKIIADDNQHIRKNPKMSASSFPELTWISGKFPRRSGGLVPRGRTSMSSGDNLTGSNLPPPDEGAKEI